MNDMIHPPLNADLDMLFEPMAAEEIASQDLTEPGYEFPDWEPSAEDEEKVERYLRAFRYYKGQLDEIERACAPAAAAEIRRVDEWLAAQTRDSRNALAFLTHRLQSFSEAVDRKRRVSPHGVLKWAKGRERVEFPESVDYATEAVARFCELHTDSGFVTVETKKRPNKKAIHDAVKAGGEIPDGADIVRAPDTFKIEVPV